METRQDLSKYRLEQVEQCLQSANILLNNHDYKGAANRSYYCVFHSMYTEYSCLKCRIFFTANKKALNRHDIKFNRNNSKTPHNNVGRSSFSAVCHALDLLRDDEAVIFYFIGQVAA